MKIKELKKLHDDAEKFLLAYAAGEYGKCGDDIDITPEVVATCMEKASADDLDEILSYNTPNIIAELMKDKDTDLAGASDLEDYIRYILNKDENL